MTYAASGQLGNLRVNGIQPETKHIAVMTVMMIGAVFVSQNRPNKLTEEKKGRGGDEWNLNSVIGG